MAKGDVAMVAGLAGFLLGGGGVYVAMSMRQDVEDLKNERRQDEESLAGLGGRFEELDRAQNDVNKRLNALEVTPGTRTDRFASIETRLAALEAAQGAHGNGNAPLTPTATESFGPGSEFDALKKKVFDDTATTDEQAKFMEMLRQKPEILEGWIADAQKAVKDAPRDKEAHRSLGDLYLLKLMSVPDGMEKGIWSNKMIGEQKAILDIDPEDWGAHFSIATNYSFWPEQFNKRPDAIKEFEACRRIQEASTPEPRHAQTYFQLRQLYLKDGRTDDAKAVLDEGLRRFPDDAELKKAAGK